MFTISNQTDYALLFIEYLSRQKDATSLLHVVEDLGLPRRFMAQIAAKLVSAKILESREGVKGGYKLSRPLSKIKLYDLLIIFEGNMTLVKCADGEYECEFEKACRHKHYWKKALTQEFIKTLNKLTVEDILKNPSSRAQATRSHKHEIASSIRSSQ